MVWGFFSRRTRKTTISHALKIAICLILYGWNCAKTCTCHVSIYYFDFFEPSASVQKWEMFFTEISTGQSLSCLKITCVYHFSHNICYNFPCKCSLICWSDLYLWRGHVFCCTRWAYGIYSAANMLEPSLQGPVEQWSWCNWESCLHCSCYMVPIFGISIS